MRLPCHYASAKLVNDAGKTMQRLVLLRITFVVGNGISRAFPLIVTDLDGEFDVISQVRSNAIAAVHLGHVEEDFSNNVGALDEPKIILQAVDHALNHVKW